MTPLALGVTVPTQVKAQERVASLGQCRADVRIAPGVLPQAVHKTDDGTGLAFWVPALGEEPQSIACLPGEFDVFHFASPLALDYASVWSLSYHETVRHTSPQFPEFPECPQRSSRWEARPLGRSPRPALLPEPLGGELVDELQACYNPLVQAEIQHQRPNRWHPWENCFASHEDSYCSTVHGCTCLSGGLRLGACAVAGTLAQADGCTTHTASRCDPVVGWRAR